MEFGKVSQAPVWFMSNMPLVVDLHNRQRVRNLSIVAVI